ncbi:MAG: AMP-binding protein, partial [Bifidobacteriaceae bacterium]|nr:AMP-binding protein [Bifidobacteriaceae bacterium]
MRSFDCPAIVPPADAAMSVPDFLLGRLARDPRGPMVEVRDRPGGPFRPLSATHVFERVRLLARGLIALGVQPGDRVAIMGRTSWDWTRLDLALWFAGAVPVPIYQTSSPEQVAWILGDAGVRFVFADDDEMADTIAEARAAGPDTVQRVLVIAGGALDQVARRGLRVPPEELERRRRGIRPSDLATVIYTSGTTGRPKGVELTHANMTVA